MKKLALHIFLPIVLATIGEFILKIAIMTSPVIVTFSGILQMLFRPGVILGILFIFSGGIIWLIAMSKYELSFIYPFLSVNYVAILLGSQLLLKEEINFLRYVAIIFIIIGLVFISRSKYSASEE